MSPVNVSGYMDTRSLTVAGTSGASQYHDDMMVPVVIAIGGLLGCLIVCICTLALAGLPRLQSKHSPPVPLGLAPKYPARRKNSSAAPLGLDRELQVLSKPKSSAVSCTTSAKPLQILRLGPSDHPICRQVNYADLKNFYPVRGLYSCIPAITQQHLYLQAQGHRIGSDVSTSASSKLSSQLLLPVSSASWVGKRPFNTPIATDCAKTHHVASHFEIHSDPLDLD